jgi:HK97 family phage prohead protease
MAQPTDFRNLPAPILERLHAVIGDVAPGRATRSGLDVVQRGMLLEARRFTRPELRTDEDGTAILDGYASVYDYPYDVAGGAPYGWTETIAPGAADKTIRESDPVKLLFDHDGLPLASTTGGTLTLRSDKNGIGVAGTFSPTSHFANDVVDAMRRGDLDSMSMAFRVTRQEWNDDYTERRISEIRLFDVSVVSFPANPAAVAQLRSDPPATKAPGMSIALARAIAAAARTSTPV